MPPDAPSAPSERGDKARIAHMLKSAADAVVILGDLDAQALSTDMIRCRALVNYFTEIGEAASRLSPQGRAAVGEFPWK